MMIAPLPHRIGIALAAAAGLAATPARAWGDDGHKVVALIAANYLTPEAAAKVAELLSGPALPGKPDDFSDVPNDIASRATWADKYRDSDRRQIPTSRYSTTREWHFVDIEVAAPDVDAACFGHPVPDTPFPGRPDNCIIDKIAQFTAVLKDPAATHDDKVVALEFLLHFVGDIHQPLHAADRHDQGGNAVKVKHSFVTAGKTHTQTIKLHAYWDKVTVGRLGSTPETIAPVLIAAIPKTPGAVWTETDPTAWAQGSFAVAKAKAYALPKAAAAGKTVILSKTYVTAATGAARKQLQLAGYRLGALLNDALQ